MAEIRQTVDLDVSRSLQGLESLAILAGKLDGTLQALGDAQRGAFSGAEKAVRDFNKELADGTKIYQKIENSAKGFENELKRLKDVYKDLQKNQKQFIAEGRFVEMQQNIAGVKARIKELGGSYDDAIKKQKKITTEGTGLFGKLQGSIGGIGSALAGAFAVGAVLNWAKQAGSAILDVTAEFQKFEAVLTTSLGSNSAAERALLMIQDFAARTPFSVQQLTDSYVKLAARGIRPTTKELQALGDLASSTGKSFDQLSEAVLDAMSGENERLKEFGVLAKRSGETTQFTFKGVTTEVKNTDEAIKEYLISLGQVEGVSGSMAAISQTLTGQMSNLGDAIDNLFLTIGQQETGAMSSFIGFLSDSVELITELSSTTEQLAKKRSAAGISEFAEEIESKLSGVASTAKGSAEEVRVALEAETAALEKTLNKLLTNAQANAEKVRNTAFLKNDVVNAETKVKLIEGELKAIEDARNAVIADYTKKQNQTEAERAIEAAKRAEENGKKEKAAREKALKDLYKELEDLEKKAAQARINLLNKNSEAYLKAQLDADLQAVEQIEKSIIAQQRAAGKNVGLTTEQEEQIRILSTEATKKYYDGLYKLQQAQADKILDLQKDTDEKQLQQITNKYDAEIRAAEEAGQREVAVALETAKQRELIIARRNQANKNLDFEEDLSIESAKLDLNRLQGVDVAEMERLKQQKLLDIQIEFAQKRLALVANETDDESLLRQLQLKNMLYELNRQKEEAMARESRFSLAKLLGITEGEVDALKHHLGETVNQLANFLSETVAIRERDVANLSRAIDEKGRELDRELQLNEQGFASNVQTKQAEYEALRAQREKAMRDQQRAQRAQVALDSVVQGSNLITASTDVYKSVAPMGVFGIPLAIGIIAAMFGSFFAAKAKALQATKTPSFAKGGEGRLIEGPSHSRGGIDVVENNTGRKILNMEGGENFYVTNKKSTDKYWPLLDAINKNDTFSIINYAFNDLLDGTGVVPHPELPKKLQTAQFEASKVKNSPHNDRLQREANAHLAKISSFMEPQEEIIELPDKTIYKKGNNTRIVRKNV